MDITFTLQLPRDALSIPVVRRVLQSSMRTLGVTDDCRTDVEIALTEACTNVLDHAAMGDEYEVKAGIDENGCVIEVIDTGRGFDAQHLGHAEAEPTAEEGRGIQLIRALVDKVQFKARPEAGTIVRLEKELDYAEGSPMRRLSDRGTDTARLELADAEPALADRAEALEELPSDLASG